MEDNGCLCFILTMVLCFVILIFVTCVSIQDSQKLCVNEPSPKMYTITMTKAEYDAYNKTKSEVKDGK